MNVYQKINAIKKVIASTQIKKSGRNDFSGFNYFELKDFLPIIIVECDKLQLHTAITFVGDTATLTITNIEKTDEVVKYDSQFVIPSNKKMNEAQELGAAQTYIRRYLYVNAFDILEDDVFDATMGKSNAVQLKSLINAATTIDEINQLLVGVLLEKDNANLKRALNAKALSLSLEFDKEKKKYVIPQQDDLGYVGNGEFI